MPTLDWKPEANDVIIPLIGLTGAGKSTFINFIAEKDVTTVGHDLQLCTAKFLPVIIGSLQSNLSKGGRLVLLDTPGLDDTDGDILHDIGSWLETMNNSGDSHGHKGEMKLAGIVYLHDISLTRTMLGSTLPNLVFFQKLCGKDALKRVVLCTTKWSDIYQEEGERRTTQLKEIYWREMIEGGSTVHKFEDSQKSAWDVIVPIIKEDRLGKIQEELEKLIPATEEGLQMRNSLDQLLESFRQASSNDFFLRNGLDARIAATRDQMRAIPVPQQWLDLFDKIINKFTSPSPSRVPTVGKRLTADVEELVMLLGETETSYERLLELSAAEITNFGGGEHATAEVRCWCVKRQDLKPLFVVAAPSFDFHQGGNPAIFKKVRTWLSSSCREDMQFGIVFLHSSIHPSPSEPSHAGRALELVERSGFKFSALFATFASEAIGTVEYGFDGTVAPFQETKEQALKMFDIALSNPVSLDLLLEGLQAILEGATNRVRKVMQRRST